MLYSELAQQTIHRLLSGIEQSGDGINKALNGALVDLVTELRIDRGLIWQVIVTDLTVIHECSSDGSKEMVKASIDCMNSAKLTLGFLSELDGKNGTRFVEIHDSKPSKGVPGDWSPFLKFGQQYPSSILLPMRGRDILPGFLSFESKRLRTWSPDEQSTLSEVARMIAVLLSYEFEIARLKGSFPKVPASGS